VVDSQEFMQRSGRFLYLDWAQAKVIAARTAPDGHYESLTAEHNGYRKISVTHARKVTIDDDGRWEIIDHLDGSSGSIHTARLHWLLPDWEYEILAPSNKTGLLSYNIRFHSPYGLITLNVSVSSVQGNKNLIQTSNFQLVRAGMLLFGTGIVSPITGWTSPKYGDKIPALACILEVYQTLPIEFKSEWILPSES
jgi:hypothetical protein